MWELDTRFHTPGWAERKLKELMSNNKLPANTLTNADGTSYAAGHDERAAFEKAITVDGLFVNLTRIGPASSYAGEYADVIVQTCWRVWQCALAYAGK